MNTIRLEFIQRRRNEKEDFDFNDYRRGFCDGRQYRRRLWRYHLRLFGHESSLRYSGHNRCTKCHKHKSSEQRSLSNRRREIKHYTPELYGASKGFGGAFSIGFLSSRINSGSENGAISHRKSAHANTALP